jgi:hypothetical protein
MLADSGTGVGSNAVTVPIAVAGRACGQPSFVVDPSVAQALGSQATVKVGSLSISQSGVQAIAGGSFYSLPGATFAALAGTATGAAGSCVVVPPDASSQIGDLGAGGAVSVTGPSGPQPLTTGDLANYGGIVPTSTIPAAGAALKFVSGGGPGATIGAFTAGVNYPAPLEWTNQDSIGAINRSQGVQLTWTGGDVDGTVAIRGSSFAAAGSKTPNTSFMCSVPANAGQFTVPPAILQALPAGAGTLTLENQSAPQQLAASGLDIGYIFAGPRLTINTPYN